MRRSLQLLMLFSLSLQALAASDVSHRLMALFDEAERCYLIDDYQRLHECIGEYYQLFDVNRQQLTDSADVYEAYYQKMCGSYYYGWAEEQRYAALAEDYYRKSLETFRRRVAATNIWGMHPNELTLHRELAQLYYKAKTGPAPSSTQSSFTTTIKAISPLTMPPDMRSWPSWLYVMPG